MPIEVVAAAVGAEETEGSTTLADLQQARARPVLALAARTESLLEAVAVAVEKLAMAGASLH